MARTFCCLQTTARGWLQVGRLILSRGRAPDGEPVVPEQWVIDATTPAATNPNYGYQLWLGSPAGKERRYSRTSVAVAKHSEPFLAPDVVFLDGWGGQRVYVVPSHELVIVRTGRPQTEWDDARLVNVILRGLGHDAPPTAASG
jgi:CubicO group peptidase (beta-lactamase class C family)